MRFSLSYLETISGPILLDEGNIDHKQKSHPRVSGWLRINCECFPLLNFKSVVFYSIGNLFSRLTFSKGFMDKRHILLFKIRS